MIRTIVVLVSLAFACPRLFADEGQPVAIRMLSAGRVAIQSHWGLRLTVASESSPTSSDNDRTIGLGQSIDHAWTRRANESQVQWRPKDSDATLDANAWSVKSIDEGGIQIVVDGVVILVGSARSNRLPTTDRPIDRSMFWSCLTRTPTVTPVNR